MIKIPVVRAESVSNRNIHGGRLRTLQLEELFSECGIELEEVLIHIPTTGFRKYINWFKGGLRVWFLPFKYLFSRECVRFVTKGIGFRDNLNSTNKECCFVEATGSPYALEIVKRTGFSHAIIFPHNLEIYNQVNCSWTDLPSEIHGAMSWADHIWTISSEEAWLISQYLPGRVGWLPYWPPSFLRERCKNIYFERQQIKDKSGVLYLGTRQGIADESVKKLLLTCETEKIDLVVCGNQTECYKDLMDFRFVDIRGYVADNELADLLTKVRCALVWNEKGSGALTRIPEMLLCGVPVVANIAALRSAWLWDGVVPVQDIDSLGSAITICEDLELNGEVPDSILQLKKQFCCWLERFSIEI